MSSPYYSLFIFIEYIMAACRKLHTIYMYMHAIYMYMHAIYMYMHTIYMYMHTIYRYMYMFTSEEGECKTFFKFYFYFSLVQFILMTAYSWPTFILIFIPPTYN
jgi:hypothetical protein